MSSSHPIGEQVAQPVRLLAAAFFRITNFKRDQYANLTRPATDATMTPDGATNLRASINNHARSPQRPLGAMPLSLDD